MLYGDPFDQDRILPLAALPRSDSSEGILRQPSRIPVDTVDYPSTRAKSGPFWFRGETRSGFRSFGFPSSNSHETRKHPRKPSVYRGFRGSKTRNSPRKGFSWRVPKNVSEKKFFRVAIQKTFLENPFWRSVPKKLFWKGFFCAPVENPVLDPLSKSWTLRRLPVASM